MSISYEQIKNWHGDKIDILNITLRNKKHQHCQLKIASSKGARHRGLYCCYHKKWLQWITYEQEKYLTEQGILAEPIQYQDLTWE